MSSTSPSAVTHPSRVTDAGYVASPLHGPERRFRETNCYTDLWIELVHARGFDAAPMMAYMLAADFEVDQWTFVKPPPEDLELLYGVDVHEMQLYRPVLDHAADALAAGRTITVEVDSYWLPDTHATSYRTEHVKTTIAFDVLDTSRKWVRYFHNAGRFEAEGDDFDGLFPTAHPDDWMPPYMESVRFDMGVPPTGDAFDRAVLGRIRHHLARQPADDPWGRFATALEAALPIMRDGDPQLFHGYAFATVRQIGSAAECAADLASWCERLAPGDAPTTRDAFLDVSDACKATLLRMARRKPFDVGPLMQRCQTGWETGIAGMTRIAAR